jgi:transcriptional regulator with XRE-family HTH domain
VTSAQIRASRGLLDWTVGDLAERAGVPRNTLSNIETGAYAGAPETLAAIRRVLERAGVEFTNGDAPGVEAEMTSPESALQVEVVGNEIVVSLPESQYSVTFTRRKRLPNCAQSTSQKNTIRADDRVRVPRTGLEAR